MDEKDGRKVIWSTLSPSQCRGKVNYGCYQWVIHQKTALVWLIVVRPRRVRFP